MIHLRTILHPTDFSEDSRYALEVACALARDQAARVLLLHVVPRTALLGRDPNVPAFKNEHTDEDLQAYRDEMMARLQTLQAEASAARVEPVLKEGEVATVITRLAEQTPCDLIVMGTHGQSGGRQGTMGSVAREVARQATCPVVSVTVPLSAPTAANKPRQAGAVA